MQNPRYEWQVEFAAGPAWRKPGFITIWRLHWLTELDMFIVGLLCGMWLLYIAVRGVNKWRATRRLAHSRAGEQKAYTLLERAGYQIIDTQKPRHFCIHVNGLSQPCCVRADYIVHKGSSTFVAEVKTGRDAPDPANRATRRQLLEYYYVYRPDGVLLVDADQETIDLITFDIQYSNDQVYKWTVTVTIIIISFIIGYFVAKGGI